MEFKNLNTFYNFQSLYIKNKNWSFGIMKFNNVKKLNTFWNREVLKILESD